MQKEIYSNVDEALKLVPACESGVGVRRKGQGEEEEEKERGLEGEKDRRHFN